MLHSIFLIRLGQYSNFTFSFEMNSLLKCYWVLIWLSINRTLSSIGNNANLAVVWYLCQFSRNQIPISARSFLSHTTLHLHNMLPFTLLVAIIKTHQTTYHSQKIFQSQEILNFGNATTYARSCPFAKLDVESNLMLHILRPIFMSKFIINFMYLCQLWCWIQPFP